MARSGSQTPNLPEGDWEAAVQEHFAREVLQEEADERARITGFLSENILRSLGYRSADEVMAGYDAEVRAANDIDEKSVKIEDDVVGGVSGSGVEVHVASISAATENPPTSTFLITPPPTNILSQQPFTPIETTVSDEGNATAFKAAVHRLTTALLSTMGSHSSDPAVLCFDVKSLITNLTEESAAGITGSTTSINEDEAAKNAQVVGDAELAEHAKSTGLIQTYAHNQPASVFALLVDALATEVRNLAVRGDGSQDSINFNSQAITYVNKQTLENLQQLANEHHGEIPRDFTAVNRALDKVTAAINQVGRGNGGGGFCVVM